MRYHRKKCKVKLQTSSSVADFIYLLFLAWKSNLKTYLKHACLNLPQAHLLISHLMLLSLKLLAWPLGGIEFATCVGKPCGAGSGYYLHSRDLQRKRKPQMRETEQRGGWDGGGHALPRKRFSKTRAFLS